MSLKLALSSVVPSKQAADVLVVATQQSKLIGHPALESIAKSTLERWDAVLQGAEFTGAQDQAVDIQVHGEIAAKRLVVVGLGATLEGGESSSTVQLRRAVAAAVRGLLGRNPERLALAVPSTTDSAGLRAAAEGVVLGAYRFTRYLTGERLPKAELHAVSIHPMRPTTKSDRLAVELGRRVGVAVCAARDAVNEPPNELTPDVLADNARGLAGRYKLKITVLDEKALAKRGMKLHLAVGAGSHNPPRLIHLIYTPVGKGRKKCPKVVFVGKGLTFDSGGLCLKPAPGMGEMKSDMAGAAAVMGLMEAVAAVAPAVEVHGIIAAAENMPDGRAYRPGDIIGSLDGKTVEIVNTDAEGRLVLADALTYASALAPDVIVDAATLTGACVVALGKTYSAYYSADEALVERFAAAARCSGEGFWRMPLIAELKEQLKSDVADLKHVGDRWGGSITAALFLREFVGTTPWIHCDIAGPVLADAAQGIVPKGATGHPVLTFLGFVERYSETE
jgi:leucyl aminopeptidase